MARVSARFDVACAELHSTVGGLFLAELIRIGDDRQLHLLQRERSRAVLGQPSPARCRTIHALVRVGGGVIDRQTDEAHGCTIEGDGRVNLDESNIIEKQIIVVILVQYHRFDLMTHGIGIVDVMRTDDGEHVRDRLRIDVVQTMRGRDDVPGTDQGPAAERKARIGRWPLVERPAKAHWKNRMLRCIRRARGDLPIHGQECSRAVNPPTIFDRETIGWTVGHPHCAGAGWQNCETSSWNCRHGKRSRSKFRYDIPADENRRNRNKNGSLPNVRLGTNAITSM